MAYTRDITEWATLLEGDYLVLDTETTGLDDHAEICELAIIDEHGSVLLDTRVQPVHGIPADATAIHGIRDQDVAGAPTLGEALDQDLLRLLQLANIVIYNRDYDLRIIRQSAAALGRYDIVTVAMSAYARSYCLMELYAEYWGAWSPYHQSYTWQSLENAAKQQGLTWEGEPHSALGDALMSLRLLERIAERQRERRAQR